MKKIFSSLLVLMSVSTSFASIASLDDVRSCLKEIHGTTEPSKRSDLINRCYDDALPWANSASLQGRSLYLQALQNYLIPRSDRYGFQLFTDKLVSYYRQHLDADINSEQMKIWSDLEIRTVYDALSILEFYSSKIYKTDIALQKYQEVFENLEQRRLATANDAHSLFAALVSNGAWQSANEAWERWPSIANSKLPTVIGDAPVSSSGWGYYVVSKDLKTMTLKQFDLGHGPRIVISGFCHFAEDLLRILSKDAEISEIMKENGIVINPNDLSDFDFEKMDSLRKEMPDFEIHPVSSAGAWFSQGINTISSPSILFLRDGQPRYQSELGIYTVEDFCRGLKSIGIALPRSCVH